MRLKSLEDDCDWRAILRESRETWVGSYDEYTVERDGHKLKNVQLGASRGGDSDAGVSSPLLRRD